jgi:hypothetical protein
MADLIATVSAISPASANQGAVGAIGRASVALSGASARSGAGHVVSMR